MKKSDKVRIKAEVQTSYYNLSGWELMHKPTLGRPKSLYRCKRSIEGLVLGYTFLSTGGGNLRRGGWSTEYDNYESAYLKVDKRFKVWVVEPLGNDSNRYYKPIRCLEEDLEVLLPLEGTFDSGEWQVKDLNDGPEFSDHRYALLGVKFNE